VLVAHISDLHLRSFDGVRPWAFFGQRILGGLNLLLNRAAEFPPDLVDALLSDLADVQPDHLVISGDVTNLSLRPEFELVKQTLDRCCFAREQVTIVPGNHDAYTYPNLLTHDFERHLEDYLETDLVVGTGRYPLVHLRDEVAIVALSSARPSPPTMAVGSLGSQQLEAVERALCHPDLRQRFRLIVVHHPPHGENVHWHQRLIDADGLRAVIERAGAELIVHGHLHRELRTEIPGPDGLGVPVIGLNSSTWLSQDPARRASYNLYQIEEHRRLSVVSRRRFDLESRRFAPDAQDAD
jgi:3',5'-cyclic AMP phosphodiesterase CpdA